jgi:CHAT domain-containing protein/tetratricopeptide (TPR) repeat protein
MFHSRTGRFVVLFLIGLAATAVSAGAAVRAALPVPNSERRAVAEIERLSDARQFAAADSLARALVTRSEAGGKRRYPLADALDLRAALLFAWGRPNDAEFATIAGRAVIVREAAGKPEPARHAAALRTLGIARLRRLEYPAADTLLARSLAILQSAPQRDAAATVATMGWLAEAKRTTRQLKPAEETAKQALAALPAGAPFDTAMVVRIHVTLGNTLAERGRPEEGITELTRAFDLQQSRAAPDSVSLGAICRFLGRAHAVAGDELASTGWFMRALEIQERALGPDHAEVATTLYQLGFNQLNAGDPMGARRSAERALRIREKVFGPNHQQVAIALWQVGGAQRELGDFEGALVHYERSVAILRAADPPLPADLATGLNNLGGALIQCGEGARARAALEEGMAIRERVLGPGAGRSYWTLTRLGQALTLEGRTAEAAAILDTVLASNLRHGPYELADALQRRASVAWMANDLATTHRCFDQAFGILDSLSGTHSTRTLDALNARAAARWALGRRADAFADARRGEQVAVEVIRSTARGLSERDALAYEGSRLTGRDVMLALAADSVGVGVDARTTVFDAVVRSRLAVLDELADESRAVPRDDPSLAPLVHDLEQARVELARAMVITLRDGSPPDSLVDAARTRRENAERALAARSGSFRAVARRVSAGGAEVATALPPGSALVSYVRYEDPRRILDLDTPAEKMDIRPARYAALVLRAGQKTPVVVPLGDAASLESTLDAWATALATPPVAATAGAEASRRRCDAIGRSVRERIWDPVTQALGKADPVFVVPDGTLHRVNFGALPSAKDGPYLVERGPLLHRLTAERDLVPWEAPTGGEGMLALGGVDFDRADGASPAIASSEPLAVAGIRAVRSSIPDSLRVRFTSLPQTALEVAEVARIWRESGAGEPIELIGAAAGEADFKQRATGRRFLHIATHGFALGAPAPSAEGMRGIGGVGAAGSSGARRAAPLLPGLALAGANAPADPQSEDGFLTAEEITALDLSSVEWAVLSACETGRSDPGAVEAVQGLHRSFRRAGARTVIVSLWAVDDAATRTWMGDLYRARLVTRRNTAESVRDASRQMLAERRKAKQDLHPFHWAAFVASGDWR